MITYFVDTNGGKCFNRGLTHDGKNAFLYGQPCLPSARLDESFDTTLVADGLHHLQVQITDASGNAATVVDRQVMFQNGAQPAAPAAGGLPALTPLGQPLTAVGPAKLAALGLPNGIGATASAAIRARWTVTSAPRLVSSWGRSRSITGTLSGQAGRPIGGALVQVLEKASYLGAPTQTETPVTTAADGRFTITVPGNASSRTIEIRYSNVLGGPPVSTARLALAVPAALSMTVAPHVSGVGRTITFRGMLRGSPLPPGGKQLVLEARQPGAAWIQFQVVRTGAGGRFRSTYRFRFPGPALYQFRAQSNYEAAFPFVQGASNVVAVAER